MASLLKAGDDRPQSDSWGTALVPLLDASFAAEKDNSTWAVPWSFGFLPGHFHQSRRPREETTRLRRRLWRCEEMAWRNFNSVRKRKFPCTEAGTSISTELISPWWVSWCWAIAPARGARQSPGISASSTIFHSIASSRWPFSVCTPVPVPRRTPASVPVRDAVPRPLCCYSPRP